MRRSLVVVLLLVAACSGSSSGSSGAGSSGAGSSGGASSGGGSSFCHGYRPASNVRLPFCSDFDESSDPSAGWNGLVTVGGGTMTIDTQTPSSPPNAGRSTGTGAAHANLSVVLSDSSKTFALSFDLRIVDLPAAVVSLASVTLGDGGPSFAVEIVGGPTPSYRIELGQPGTMKAFEFKTQPVVGEWHRISAGLVDMTSVSFAVDHSPAEIQALPSREGGGSRWTFGLGALPVGAGTATVLYDNVTFELM